MFKVLQLQTLDKSTKIKRNLSLLFFCYWKWEFAFIWLQIIEQYFHLKYIKINKFKFYIFGHFYILKKEWMNKNNVFILQLKTFVLLFFYKKN